MNQQELLNQINHQNLLIGNFQSKVGEIKQFIDQTQPQLDQIRNNVENEKRISAELRVKSQHTIQDMKSNINKANDMINKMKKWFPTDKTSK